MPTYAYRCEDCDHEFEVDETMNAHDESDPACPECGSDDVRRVFAGSFVQTSSKT